MIMNEIMTQAKIDYEEVVRGVVGKIRFDSCVDDLSSVDSKGLCDKTCKVLVCIDKQGRAGRVREDDAGEHGHEDHEGHG